MIFVPLHYFTTGKPFSLNFNDANSERVEVDPSASVTDVDQWTIEFWAYPETSPTNPMAVYHGIPANWPNDAILTYVGDTFGLNNPGARTWHEGVQITHDKDLLNQWNHVAIRRNGDARELYVNGAQQASDTVFSGVSPWTSTVTSIGAGDDDTASGTQFFDGNIQEVRLWKEYRTGAQLERDKNRRLTGGEPNLVGYWPLIEGTGTTAHDWSGNRNHGVFVNSPTWERSP